MSDIMRPRYGTKAENDGYIGLDGEISIDRETQHLRIHDGVTAGGAKVVANQDEVKVVQDGLQGLQEAVDSIDVGVTSFNGEKGAVTYSAPVTSVNGQTGAVTVNVGVTSFNGSTGAVTYSAPVTSVMGKTGAVTGLVSSVNGIVADPSGNVTLELGGTVSLKQTISANATSSYGTSTVTVSGLTANKPVYVVGITKDTSADNYGVMFFISSGVIATQSDKTVPGSGNYAQGAQSARGISTNVTTGTSIAITYTAYKGATFEVYQ